MKKITKIASVAAVALMMTLTNGCKKEEMPVSSGAGAASGESAQKTFPTPDVAKPVTVELRMIGYDAGRFGSLECGIETVALHFVSQGAFPMSRWVEVPLRRLPMNVLNFNWEQPMKLADLSIPDGSLTEIRLNFANQGVVAWGDKDGRHSVLAGFARTSVTLPATGNIVKGKKLEVFLGFDVAQSLTYEGGLHPYTIDPVVRALLIGNGKEVISENNK